MSGPTRGEHRQGILASVIMCTYVLAAAVERDSAGLDDDEMAKLGEAVRILDELSQEIT